MYGPFTNEELVGKAITSGRLRQRRSPRSVIQPGPIETDINDDDAIRDIFRPLTSIGRMGQDSEVASLVADLASSESSLITGSALPIDGGYLA